jgi:hypothetical protein
MPKLRSSRGPSDVTTPQTRTNPQALAEVWGVELHTTNGTGASLAPMSKDKGSVVVVGDDPLDQGHGTGPVDVGPRLIEYLQAAVKIVIVAGPGISFFYNPMIFSAAKYRRPTILVATNWRHRQAWCDRMLAEAPKAIIATIEPNRGDLVLLREVKPQDMPPAQWPPADLLKANGITA